MKIKMLQSIAGHAEPRYALADFSFPPGCVVDVDADLAKAWIASKIALAADRNEKLTMPIEVYTLSPDSPVLQTFQKAQAEEAANAAADARAAREAAAVGEQPEAETQE